MTFLIRCIFVTESKISEWIPEPRTKLNIEKLFETKQEKEENMHAPGVLLSRFGLLFCVYYYYVLSLVHANGAGCFGIEHRFSNKYTNVTSPCVSTKFVWCILVFGCTLFLLFIHYTLPSIHFDYQPHTVTKWT